MRTRGATARAALGVVAAFGLSIGAWAAEDQGGKTTAVGSKGSLLNRGAPGGGVRAAAPKSTGLGGVRATMPSRIGSNGSLLNRKGSKLPPSPAARPPQKPTVRVPGEGNNLVKPIYLAPGVRDPRYVGPRGTIRDPKTGDLYVPSGGLTVDGKYQDPKFKLRFHLGSGYPYYLHSRSYRYSYPFYTYPYSSVYGYGSYYSTVSPYSVYGYGAAYPALDQFVASGPTAAAAQQPQPVELSDFERGDILLAHGEVSEAIDAYRAYLKDAPDDAAAIRSFALAQLQNRKLDQAAALMAYAYELSPELAYTAVPQELIPGGEMDLRQELNRAVAYANRVKTSSAWLLVAVLMQAEGREDVAAKMVERAREVGLPERVASELKLALGR